MAAGRDNERREHQDLKSGAAACLHLESELVPKLLRAPSRCARILVQTGQVGPERGYHRIRDRRHTAPLDLYHLVGLLARLRQEYIQVVLAELNVAEELEEPENVSPFGGTVGHVIPGPVDDVSVAPVPECVRDRVAARVACHRKTARAPH